MHCLFWVDEPLSESQQRACKIDPAGEGPRSGEAQILLWLPGRREGLKMTVVRDSIRLLSGSRQPARLLLDR